MKGDAERFTIKRFLTGAALIVAACFFGCARPAPPAAAAPPTAQAAGASTMPAAQAEPVNQIKLPPPNLSQVEEALKAVYQDSVILAATQFVVGDFDGDGSQDLAAVVMPASGMLPKVNSEYARWKLDDPRYAVAPDLHKIAPRSAAPREPVQAKPGDRLLAIVHGEGPYGWRHPGVNNSYLLEHASGNRIAAAPPQALLHEATDKDGLPSLRGDVIKETLAGRAGFLYYTGATYAWFDLAGKPAAATPAVHHK